MGIECVQCGDIGNAFCPLDDECPFQANEECDECGGIFDRSAEETNLCDGEEFGGCSQVICITCSRKRQCVECQWGFCSGCAGDLLAACKACGSYVCKKCRGGYPACCDVPAFA